METLTRNKNKGKTRIDWDLNIYSPEQWYGPDEGSFWDPELWQINARMYNETACIDTNYLITLLPKEAEAIGLVQHAEASNADHNGILDDWLDAGLDGFIDQHTFLKLYKDKLSPRLLEWLETLPQYIEDVPARMRY